MTPLDEEIGRWLRVETTPVIVVANKAEGRAGEAGILDALSRSASAIRSRSAPSMAKAWPTCSRRFGRMSSSER